MQLLKNTYQQVNQVIEIATNLQNVVAHVTIVQEPWFDVTEIQIIQRSDTCECCFPCYCEGENFYDITTKEKNGSFTKNVGSVQEKAPCCDRFCCQQFRQFKLQLYTDYSFNEVQAMSEKPCGCTCTPMMGGCCCCNGLPCSRPLMVVTRGTQIVGKVSNPYRCMGRNENNCSLEELDILDASGNVRYMISATCCQPGQICRALGLCRGFCQGPDQIMFKILDQNKTQVGEITNVYNGFCTELCTKQDKFQIRFPNTASYNDKLLIIHAVIMIDFDIFEDTCCRLA